MNQNESTRELLDKVLLANTETLYASIGYLASSDRLGVAPEDKNKLLERGKTWMEERKLRLRALICENQQVRELLLSEDRKKSDVKDTILVIADLIASVCGGIPALYPASLLVKIGLREWCRDEIP